MTKHRLAKVNSRIVAVVGTDTGVGKTFLATKLLSYSRRVDILARAFKPIETGCVRQENGELFPADGAALFNALEGVQPLDEIVPLRFERPVAPFVAAFQEGESISLTKLTEQLSNLQRAASITIVEGAGGLLSPWSDEHSLIDLLKPFREIVDVVIIAPNKLGVLNSVLLTYEALSQAGLRLTNVVLNRIGDGTGAISDQSEVVNSKIVNSKDVDSSAVASNCWALEQLFKKRQQAIVKVFDGQDNWEVLVSQILKV